MELTFRDKRICELSFSRIIFEQKIQVSSSFLSSEVKPSTDILRALRYPGWLKKTCKNVITIVSFVNNMRQYKVKRAGKLLAELLFSRSR